MNTVASSILEHRGSRLAYDLVGDGPPVVLIQGVGVHGGGWRPQVDALSPRFRCLTFDHRGLNRSQPLGGPLTVEQMADDTAALMDAQGWATAHVVGHSLGGLIALHLALSAGARVRSLSLLCTFATGREATRLSPGMLWTGLRTRLGTRRQRRHAFLELVLPPGERSRADRDAEAERLAPLFGHDLAVQPPVAMKQLAAMSRYDAGPRLGELAGLPTLVVSAGHDRIARPELGRALAAGGPGARYVEIAEAAHGVPLHLPARINELLLDHLATAELRASRPEEIQTLPFPSLKTP